MQYNQAEHVREKICKMRINLGNSVTPSNVISSSLYGSQKQEKGAKDLFEEIIAENFPNQGKETYIQIQ